MSTLYLKPYVIDYSNHRTVFSIILSQSKLNNEK